MQQPEFLKKIEAYLERKKKPKPLIKPQPDSPFGTPYGGFHRRMIAATIDMLVLTFTVLPLSYVLTNALIGEVDMNLAPLFSALQYVTDPGERTQIIGEFLVDSGRLQYFNVNTLMQIVGIFIYCIVFWMKWQATPGKMLTRLVVVDEKTGNTLNFIQAFWRCVGYVVGSAALCIGVFWIGFDKRRQGWHDKLGSSVVIIKPRHSA